MTTKTIMRDTANNASNMTIVRMTTTDVIDDILKPNWLADQADDIAIAAGGEFTFTPDDLILMRYGNQSGSPDANYLFYVSRDLQSVIPISYTYPYNFPVTAHSGGGQANATQLKIGSNSVKTVAANTDSVKLPDDVLGQTVIVFNSTANTLSIFPFLGDRIDVFAVNAPINVGAFGRKMFIGITENSWASFD